MKFSKKNTAVIAIAITSCLMGPVAWADDDEQRGKRRGPPPTEAIEACASQAEGSVCSFTGHRGDEVKGSCSVVPNDADVIACKPERGREGGRGSQSGY